MPHRLPLKRRAAFGLLTAASLLALTQISALADDVAKKPDIYSRQNLVAWCIVPFDAKKRRPAERAEMIKRLGITKVAYDWRDEHVPTFEQEIVEYKKHGIEYFAFWSWHENMRPLIQKYGIHPQIWITASSPTEGPQDQKIEAAAKSLMPLVATTRELGLKLGLYNHGGWGGEPANLVAVCERLRKVANADHVGIVYNFHHGHGHIADFATAFESMKPYLLCVNINGMNDNENPKILAVGSGQHEQQMMQVVRQSGYTGPIGIIHHRDQLDAEEGLRQNLNGLKSVLRKMGDAPALETFRN